MADWTTVYTIVVEETTKGELKEYGRKITSNWNKALYLFANGVSIVHDKGCGRVRMYMKANRSDIEGDGVLVMISSWDGMHESFWLGQTECVRALGPSELLAYHV